MLWRNPFSESGAASPIPLDRVCSAACGFYGSQPASSLASRLRSTAPPARGAANLAPWRWASPAELLGPGALAGAACDAPLRDYASSARADCQERNAEGSVLCQVRQVCEGSFGPRSACAWRGGEEAKGGACPVHRACVSDDCEPHSPLPPPLPLSLRPLASSSPIWPLISSVCGRGCGRGVADLGAACHGHTCAAAVCRGRAARRRQQIWRSGKERSPPRALVLQQ